MTENLSSRSPLSFNLFFVGLLLILTPLSMLATGYGIFLDNHAMQLPLIQMLNSPGKFYVSDPYAQSLLKYGAPVWHVVAFLDRHFDQEAVLGILFVLGRIMVLAAAGCLACALAPGSRVAIAAAMAFVAAEPKSLIGAGTILEKIFEHTSLSIGFFMLAFAAVVARRPWGWAIAWALGFFCNPMYGIFASLYLALYLVFERELLLDWRRWLSPLIAALALVTPLMMWSLFRMRPAPYDHDIWFQVATLRMEHHLNPAAWPPLGWLLAVILMGLAGVISWRVREERPRLSHFLGAATAGCVLWLLLAIVAFGLKNDTLLVMHAGRGTDLFYLFAGIGLIAYLAPREIGEQPMRPLIVLLLILVPSYFHNVGGLMYFVLIPILMGVWKPNRLVTPRWAVGLIIAALALLAVSRLIFERHGQAMILVENDVRKVGQWAREETPLDAVFLVNPEWQEFRAIARRTVFVTWKDAGAIPWQRDYATEWVKRLKAMGADVLATHDKRQAEEDVDQAWQHLTDDHVAVLSRDYGLDYWVVNEDKASRFPQVHGYGDSRVLKLR